MQTILLFISIGEFNYLKIFVRNLDLCATIFHFFFINIVIVLIKILSSKYLENLYFFLGAYRYIFKYFLSLDNQHWYCS